MAQMLAYLSLVIDESHWLHKRSMVEGFYWRSAMPTLHLEMHPGRTLEQKRTFVREVTRVVVETLVCPAESVDVVITEVSREAWAKGGTLIADVKK